MSVISSNKTLRSPLTSLPSELLGCILAEVETAQSLSRLPLTCKALYAFIEEHGYHIFVRSRFPSLHLPIPLEAPDGDGVETARRPHRLWKDATHGLTTLSKNLDRRAFIAQHIRNPESSSHNERTHGGGQHFPFQWWRGQSIGFVPVIDSYESWYGGDWSSRKEVVAWGAGAELVIRSRNMGTGQEGDEHDEMTHQPFKPHWQTYKKQGVREGLDDITSLNLLLRDSSNEEEILIGRASGDFERIHVDERGEKRTIATYETYGMPVREATVHHRDMSVAAACIGDHNIALYRLKSEGEDVKSVLDTSIQTVGEHVRTWSAAFLQEGRLAVGTGRSSQPIKIYDLGQSSLTLERAIATASGGSAKLNPPDGTDAGSPVTSVYSIVPLPPSSRSSGAEGQIFLSGAYDANVRLHDLRLGDTVVSLFSDPADADSAVYSLLPIGQERFIVGGARHFVMKVYDLRMPGQRLYHAADALRCSQGLNLSSRQKQSPKLRKRLQLSDECSSWRHCAFHASTRTPRNWNVFLSNYPQESSVYCLSRPSIVSPVIYAGIQNRITQIDLVAVLDQHPDPVYRPESSSTVSTFTPPFLQKGPCTRGTHDAYKIESDKWIKKWDPDQAVLNLCMYEQSHNISMLRQDSVRQTKSLYRRAVNHDGLDDRWPFKPLTD